MGYRRAEEILPAEIIELIQQYVDGENIYIPRKEKQRKEWGQNTRIREEIRVRNTGIYEAFLNGSSPAELAETYFLSVKSIQRIIREQKNTCSPEEKGEQNESCKKISI